ncbi:hypothetical protein BH10ACI1_BH10ACI1_02640 [soil metagenome]
MTKEEINLIEDLVYSTIQYELRKIAPTSEEWEIVNDISEIKNKLENI